MRAIKYSKDAVFIKDGNIQTWVDVWLENEDIICDWRQNYFIMTDPKQVALKNWQDELTNYLEATRIAVKTLENAQIIYQDEKGKWHQRVK